MTVGEFIRAVAPTVYKSNHVVEVYLGDDLVAQVDGVVVQDDSQRVVILLSREERRDPTVGGPNPPVIDVLVPL